MFDNCLSGIIATLTNFLCRYLVEKWLSEMSTAYIILRTGFVLVKTKGDDKQDTDFLALANQAFVLWRVLLYQPQQIVS